MCLRAYRNWKEGGGGDLGRTATAIPFIYSFSGNCAAGLSPNFHIHVSVSDLYIPRIGPHISSRRKVRPIVGIYNSLTDTWMWKLGLRPRYSFSGNICFKFSAFCLCSASLMSEYWESVSFPAAEWYRGVNTAGKKDSLQKYYYLESYSLLKFPIGVIFLLRITARSQIPYLNYCMGSNFLL
jgi:hypothetical protein